MNSLSLLIRVVASNCSPRAATCSPPLDAGRPWRGCACPGPRKRGAIPFFRTVRRTLSTRRRRRSLAATPSSTVEGTLSGSSRSMAEAVEGESPPAPRVAHGIGEALGRGLRSFDDGAADDKGGRPTMSEREALPVRYSIRGGFTRDYPAAE